jgi:hypothetical protein
MAIDTFTARTGEARVRASAYSQCIAEAAAGTPQRGSVHSVFAAAANILFPGEFILSLNASDSPRMPNGLHLSAPAGAFPFSALRPGMAVLFGASRLHIEAINCSLDLTTCPQWNPHIEHPSALNVHTVKKNYERLRALWEKHAITNQPLPSSPAGQPAAAGQLPATEPSLLYTTARSLCGQTDAGWGGDDGNVYSRATPCGWPGAGGSGSAVDGWPAEFARHLCGRGVGLTPTGDDVLAGWMAAGWLLYGPQPAFLAACARIMEVARAQTHLLSRCWLGYAAEGNVALPVVRLLETLTREPDDGDTGNTENNAQLELAAQAVLALGATSGYDVISGILLGLEQFLLTH